MSKAPVPDGWRTETDLAMAMIDDVEGPMHLAFSNWCSWADRGSHTREAAPGVYAMAITEQNIAGQRFSMRRDIVYFGMTNRQEGLSDRLWEFDETIAQK